MNNIVIFPWTVVVLLSVFLLCVSFLVAVWIGSKLGMTRLTAENKHLRDAIDTFLAAQDQPPGNWDAVDALRQARMR